MRKLLAVLALTVACASTASAKCVTNWHDLGKHGHAHYRVIDGRHCWYMPGHEAVRPRHEKHAAKPVARPVVRAVVRPATPVAAPDRQTLPVTVETPEKAAVPAAEAAAAFREKFLVSRAKYTTPQLAMGDVSWVDAPWHHETVEASMQKLHGKKAFFMALMLYFICGFGALATCGWIKMFNRRVENEKETTNGS